MVNLLVYEMAKLRFRAKYNGSILYDGFSVSPSGSLVIAGVEVAGDIMIGTNLLDTEGVEIFEGDPVGYYERSYVSGMTERVTGVVVYKPWGLCITQRDGFTSLMHISETQSTRQYTIEAGPIRL